VAPSSTHYYIPSMGRKHVIFMNLEVPAAAGPSCIEARNLLFDHRQLAEQQVPRSQSSMTPSYQLPTHQNYYQNQVIGSRGSRTNINQRATRVVYDNKRSAPLSATKTSNSDPISPHFSRERQMLIEPAQKSQEPESGRENLLNTMESPREAHPDRPQSRSQRTHSQVKSSANLQRQTAGQGGQS